MSPIGFSVAFVAGLFSFISPCVLPLVPVYLGYLSGSNLSGDASPNRWRVFTHALCFVGGFTLVIVVLLGLPTTLLGSALLRYRDWIARAGGVVLILFGLHTMGVITIPFLNMSGRIEAGRGMKPGYLRSLLVGVTFAAGWTPCIGPLLGTVITLAFTEPTRALGLLFAYALGLALPFLLTAALLARGIGWLKRLNRHMRAIEIASGVLMIGVGILLTLGLFSVLSNAVIRVTPEWLLQLL